MNHTPQPTAEPPQNHPYVCLHRGKRLMIHAPTTYRAQQLAAATLRTKKPWEISVLRADTTHSTASV
jgi:hypothetical protein